MALLVAMSLALPASTLSCGDAGADDEELGLLESAAGVWTNATFAAQAGQFAVAFDVVPTQNNENVVVGLSNGAADAYSDLAAILRFFTNGLIDARNGSAYAANTPLPYTAGQSYHVRMNIDAAAKKYSVFVTPPGKTEVALATNYAFRTDQAAVTQLNNRAVYGDPGGATISNFAISSAGVPQNIANGQTISGSQIVWTATPTSASSKVEFYIDNALKWTENYAPYRYNGDPSGYLDSTTLINGSHVLSVKAYLSAGGTASGTATVTVANGAAPPPSPSGDKLTWAPPGYPSYSGFTTITIPNTPSSNSQRDLNLNDATDYRIVIGDYAYAGGIRLRGGRNVVVIGGRITIKGGATASDRTGLKLWPRGNTYYHVEGLEVRPDPSIDGGSNLHDGIVIQGLSGEMATSGSRVVLENIRIGPTSIKNGTSDSEHSDCFQVQTNYPGQIWMDKITASFDYNCVMLSDVQVSLIDMRRVNTKGFDVNPAFTTHLHFFQGQRHQIMKLTDYWVVPGPGHTLATSFYPGGSNGRYLTFAYGTDAPTVGSDALGTYLTWPATANITGKARQGLPPNGDFVPVGIGLAYVSPGYAP